MHHILITLPNMQVSYSHCYYTGIPSLLFPTQASHSRYLVYSGITFSMCTSHSHHFLITLPKQTSPFYYQKKCCLHGIDHGPYVTMLLTQASHSHCIALQVIISLMSLKLLNLLLWWMDGQILLQTRTLQLNFTLHQMQGLWNFCSLQWSAFGHRTKILCVTLLILQCRYRTHQQSNLLGGWWCCCCS